MALVKLHTQHFRNLDDAPISFSPAINLVYGQNGSGKSSLLEAIGYLALGRSFRVGRHQAVCQHGQHKFTVFGGLDGGFDSPRQRPADGATPLAHRLGIARDLSAKETSLRVDGVAVRSLSALARHFPVSVIDPGVFDIIAGGPGKRRQFLDWSVFHVEPSFSSVWQQCQRVTSQRNQTLRNGRLDDALIKVWDSQYVVLAEQVTEARRRAFAQFSEAFRGLLAETRLPWVDGMKLEFYPGWDKTRALSDVLVAHRQQELRMGHTLYGPNRADLRLRFEGRPVAETFSRGQQKTLVVLMKIAQCMVLSAQGKQVTFLLDDINAELDIDNRAMLAEKLHTLGCQVFLTSIEKPCPRKLWRASQPAFKMFHVEHGKLTQE
ncbi:DNA replication/repair protein RecF [Marinobacter sp. X15-166B]|uniref:DNA replication/repair protein RecF n=1 Tax=Marinobacter sp. X15-166B TaxID=1897620 RepID=UPI00085C65B8|nr:DNA replication/repair protein RecF [Marinobacter sp. X15-166B]OEY66138.1 DNA replication protein RecF [Marinobacter sp. X15-166B]